MALYQITYTLTFVTSLALGFFVYTRNRTSTVNKTWFLTCIAVSSWSIFMCLYTTLPISFDNSLLFARLANISAMFIPVLFTHFALAFVDRRASKNKILISGYITASLILAFGFTRFFIPLVEPWNEFYYYARPGILYYLYTAAFIFYVLYAEIVLFKSLKTSSPSKKNQIKYMLFSTLAAFICGSFTFFGIYKINIPLLPANFTFIYTLIISYAIVKHNLWDINLVIRKGLIYSIAITILTTIYFLLIFLLENTFRNFAGYRSPFISITILIIFVFLFQPLKSYIQHIIDKYFFHGSIEQIDRENIKLREELQKTEKLKAIATLAAGMAHEIKNPLTSIKTFTEYLPEKKNDPEFLDKFQSIVGSEVDRINYIVKQLLEFSRPSKLNTEETDINILLDETVNLLNNDLLKQDIKTLKHYSPLPPVKVDPSQIKQVFLNLFLNAMESIREKGTITINTRVNSSHQISIRIEDTGIGIEKDDLQHIFDPFFSKKDGGTGLGLSVVHGIIKKHNGKISARSIPHQGTTFEVILSTNI